MEMGGEYEFKKKCDNQHLSMITDISESCQSIFGKFLFNTKIGLIIIIIIGLNIKR